MRKTLATLLIVFSVTGFGMPAGAVEIGQPAPALVVAQLDGRTFDLAAQRGKVVIVSFWATWCPPCREEMPILDKIYRRYHDRGLTVIGLSVDRASHRDDVVKIMHAFGYPAAMLSEAETNDFGRPGVMPVTYIIDAKGLIRAQFTPEQMSLTVQNLDNMVAPLLPN